MEAEFLVKLLTWNCLTSNFGEPKAFPKVNPELLKWENRAPKIKNLLSSEDADIMCLVEIDNPDYYKTNILNYKPENTFTSIYAGRKDGVMGVLLAFKNELFELVKQEICYMPSDENGTEESHVFLFVQLIQKITGKKLNIILTHLKAKFHNAKVRNLQIARITEYINKNNLMNEALIFTGDFNNEPTSENYQLVQKIGLQPAFELFDNTKPNYLNLSSVKVRDKLYKYMIDYILYNEEKINRVESFIKRDINVDLNIGLPNEDMPSDHFFIELKFNLK